MQNKNCPSYWKVVSKVTEKKSFPDTVLETLGQIRDKRMLRSHLNPSGQRPYKVSPRR